jgi:hypothetical protein
MIKRFSRIKLGSASRNSSRQLMFKKNNSGTSPGPTTSPARSKPTEVAATSTCFIQEVTTERRIRTRSQSQGKCTKLLASAFKETSSACFPCVSRMPSSPAANYAPASLFESVQCSSFTDSQVNKTIKAARADFFTWYSSVKGFVSHRDPTGSPFIRCLVAVLSRYAYEMEIQEMVYKVHYLMAQYETINHAQPESTALYMMTPVLENSLNKKLYFNP